MSSPWRRHIAKQPEDPVPLVVVCLNTNSVHLVAESLNTSPQGAPGPRDNHRRSFTKPPSSSVGECWAVSGAESLLLTATLFFLPLSSFPGGPSRLGWVIAVK